MYRDVTVYYRDGYVEKLYFNSSDNTLTINGNLIKKRAHAHSFQTEKFMPSKWRESHNLSLEEYNAAMKQSYILLLEYLKILKKDYNFELINLSESYPEISQFGQITKEWNQHT